MSAALLAARQSTPPHSAIKRIAGLLTKL